jgi:hypothetical protein
MDQSAAELAIRALETERQKLDVAIRELKALVKSGQPDAAPARKPRLSRAGRKRISEAAKRRWAKADEPQAAAAAPAKAAKKSATKKGGLTPEGRARIAEATRQRNIARAAAAKKAAAKVS